MWMVRKLEEVLSLWVCWIVDYHLVYQCARIWEYLNGLECMDVGWYLDEGCGFLLPCQFFHCQEYYNGWESRWRYNELWWFFINIFVKLFCEFKINLLWNVSRYQNLDITTLVTKCLPINWIIRIKYHFTKFLVDCL